MIRWNEEPLFIPEAINAIDRPSSQLQSKKPIYLFSQLLRQKYQSPQFIPPSNITQRCYKMRLESKKMTQSSTSKPLTH